MNQEPTKLKNPNAVALGRLGGKAGCGQSKARTTEQARQAVMVRWAKRAAQRDHLNDEAAKTINYND